MTKGKEKLDKRLQTILRRIRMKAIGSMILGMAVYATGVWWIGQNTPDDSMENSMRLFHALIIVWAVLVIYPTMRGAFEIGLDQHKRITPVFEDLKELLSGVRDDREEMRTTCAELRDAFKEAVDEIRGLRADLKEKGEFHAPDLAAGFDPLLDMPGNRRRVVDPDSETKRSTSEDLAIVCNPENGELSRLDETPEGT